MVFTLVASGNVSLDGTTGYVIRLKLIHNNVDGHRFHLNNHLHVFMW